MKRFVFLIMLFLMNSTFLWATDKVEVFPSTRYDQYTIYQNLALFWTGIIGLIVIIKMKLKEINRVQKMGIDKEEKDIPLLD